MPSDAWYQMNPGAAGAPQQPNSGQFNGNPYQNPQMGATGQEKSWGNPQGFNSGGPPGGGLAGGGGGQQWFTAPNTGLVSYIGGQP